MLRGLSPLCCSLLILSTWTVVAKSEDDFLQQSKRFEQFCDWNAEETNLLNDLRDGHLDSKSLLEASMLVSGHDPQAVAAIQSEFRDSCERCRSMTRAVPKRGADRIRQLFEYLVSNHLYGEYQPDLCDVGQTISDGDFNCLTATILFRALCKEFEIEVEAAWEPSHVRCWIPVNSNPSMQDVGYIVETTADNPAAGVSGLFPRKKLAERRLTKEELLGKVFYNRGVQALQSDDYPLALTSTWASSLLDSDDLPAANNLRACLNNWALTASKKKDRNLAVRLLDAGLQLDPTYRPFARNRRLLTNH